MTEFREGNNPAQDKIIGNPLADMKTPDRELSPQEKTVLWANQIFEDYNKLSQQTGPERKKAKSLIHETARQLLQNPERIDTAVGIWISHEKSLQSQVPGSSQQRESFYEAVRQETARVAKGDWEKIMPYQLSQFVKSYANNLLVHDFAGNLLASFFNGPQERKQKEEAFYRFASATLGLIDEPKALGEAVKIGLFETQILARGSNFYSDYRLTDVIVPLDKKEERALQQHLIAGELFQRISALTGFDARISSAKDLEYTKEFIVPATSKWRSEVNRKMSYAQKIFGEEIVRLKQEALLDCQRTLQDTKTSTDIEKIKNEWPYNLVYDENEPLNIKYGQVAGDKIQAVLFEKQDVPRFFADNHFKEYDPQSLISLSIAFAEGLRMDVLIPKSLINKKSEIIKNFLSFEFGEEKLSEIRERHSIFTSVRIHAFLQLGDFPPMWATVRQSVSSEKNQHSLQLLDVIGFPALKLEKGEDPALKNQWLADEIKRSQIRFLNKRGVRVPLNGQLKELGYSHIDFHKDANDPEKTLVKIFIGETPYSVKLDKYLNFDFEGKRFDVPFLRDALKFTLLSFLKPILCEEKIKTPTGELKELGTEVVSRMGHLRWLTHGQHYSRQAEINCFEFEGKDLCALALERQERHKGTEKEKMETTYVRPVIEKEENLPPITLHLPGVLQFN